MLRNTIDLLASQDPEYGTGIALQQFVASGDISSKLYTMAAHNYVARYAQPEYGWEAAVSFSSKKIGIPILLRGRDSWVFKAYAMLLRPEKFYNKHVADAYAIWQGASASKYGSSRNSVNHMPGSTLMGLILTCASRLSSKPIVEHFKDIAKITGQELDTVIAFEQLFYNIFDRAEDYQYLANDVYPNSRVEELREDYAHSATVRDIIKRAGYNHGDIDMTAWLAGIGDRSFMTRFAAGAENEVELTKALIANGLVLARTGAINTRNVGMRQAASLINSSRQAGMQSDSPVIGEAFPAFSANFAKAMERRVAVKNQLIRDKG